MFAFRAASDGLAKAWRDLEDAERAIHDGLGAYAGDLALRVSSEELNLASVGYAPLREFSMRVYRDFLTLAADLRAPYLIVDAHFPHRSLGERDVAKPPSGCAGPCERTTDPRPAPTAIPLTRSSLASSP